MALAPCLGQRHTQRDVPCNMSEIRCRLCSSEMTAIQTKRDVPIVFTIAPDPGAGFVESLALPGAPAMGIDVRPINVSKAAVSCRTVRLLTKGTPAGGGQSEAG